MSPSGKEHFFAIMSYCDLFEESLWRPTKVMPVTPIRQISYNYSFAEGLGAKACFSSACQS